MHNFRELKIWKAGIALVKACYEFSLLLPDSEKYGLKSQIQRASVSIPLNISEGSGKSSDKDFCRFLEIALSSAFEVETIVLITIELKLVDELPANEIIKSAQELQRMISGFRNSLL